MYVVDSLEFPAGGPGVPVDELYDMARRWQIVPGIAEKRVVPDNDVLAALDEYMARTGGFRGDDREFVNIFELGL